MRTRDLAQDIDHINDYLKNTNRLLDYIDRINRFLSYSLEAPDRAEISSVWRKTKGIQEDLTEAKSRAQKILQNLEATRQTEVPSEVQSEMNTILSKHRKLKPSLYRLEDEINFYLKKHVDSCLRLIRREVNSTIRTQEINDYFSRHRCDGFLKSISDCYDAIELDRDLYDNFSYISRKFPNVSRDIRDVKRLMPGLLLYCDAMSQKGPAFMGPRQALDGAKKTVRSKGDYYYGRGFNQYMPGRGGEWTYERNQDFFRGIIEQRRPVILVNTFSEQMVQEDVRSGNYLRNRGGMQAPLSVTGDELFWLEDHNYIFRTLPNKTVVAIPPKKRALNIAFTDYRANLTKAPWDYYNMSLITRRKERLQKTQGDLLKPVPDTHYEKDYVYCFSFSDKFFIDFPIHKPKGYIERYTEPAIPLTPKDSSSSSPPSPFFSSSSASSSEDSTALPGTDTEKEAEVKEEEEEEGEEEGEMRERKRLRR